jgi:hypothetical protein
LPSSFDEPDGQKQNITLCNFVTNEIQGSLTVFARLTVASAAAFDCAASAPPCKVEYQQKTYFKIRETTDHVTDLSLSLSLSLSLLGLTQQH